MKYTDVLLVDTLLCVRTRLFLFFVKPASNATGGHCFFHREDPIRSSDIYIYIYIYNFFLFLSILAGPTFFVSRGWTCQYDYHSNVSQGNLDDEKERDHNGQELAVHRADTSRFTMPHVTYAWILNYLHTYCQTSQIR